MNPFADVILTGASGLTEGHVVDDTVALISIGGVGLSAQWLGNILFARRHGRSRSSSCGAATTPWPCASSR